MCIRDSSCGFYGDPKINGYRIMVAINRGIFRFGIFNNDDGKVSEQEKTIKNTGIEVVL